METFWTLMKESVITQAIITVLIISAVIYLIATGQAVPENLWQLTTLVIGFYFGSKVGFVQGVNKTGK